MYKIVRGTTVISWHLLTYYSRWPRQNLTLLHNPLYENTVFFSVLLLLWTPKSVVKDHQFLSFMFLQVQIKQWYPFYSLKLQPFIVCKYKRFRPFSLFHHKQILSTFVYAFVWFLILSILLVLLEIQQWDPLVDFSYLRRIESFLISIIV